MALPIGPLVGADETPRPVASDGAAWLTLAGTALAVAVAIWLLPASAHVVDWRGGLARRVVLLPPVSALALDALAAAVAAAALGLVWSQWRRRPLGSLVPIVAPLAWLGLWAVPYLPGAASALPGLVALAGPARWAVAGAVVLRVAWAAAGHHVAAAARRLDPGPAAIFVAALAVYLGVGGWVTRATGLGGDEPHYLVITHSLLVDHDLRIENNHEARDYEAFYPIDLPMHYLRRGVGGVIYSVHAPGLPALLLPFYAVAGARGAVVAIGLFAALAAVAIYRLARDVAGREAALVAWASVCFTTPFLMHGWLVFPEMPAACLAAWALWWLWARPPDRLAVWAWRGAALGVLPWLHAKLSVILAGLGLALAFKLRRRPAAVAALAVPTAVSLALWLYAFRVMYGVADPTAPYGGMAGAGLDWANVPRGVLGLLFDQEYGLLPYSPIYALAAVGAVAAARRRDTRGLLAAAGITAAAFVASSTRYYMWWGGWSVPARFLVPVLPLLAPFVAIGIGRLGRTATGRAVVAAGALVGAAVALVLVALPDRLLMFNDRDGTGKLFELLQGIVPIVTALPSFLLEDWRVQLPRLALMVGSVAGGLLVLWVRARIARRLPLSPLGGALVVVAGSCLALAVLGRASLSRGDASEMVRAGRLSLVQAWDPPALTPVDPDALRRLDPQATLRRAILQYPRPGGELPEDLEWWWGPLELPPGRYAFQAWLRSERGPSGEIWAVFHRSRARAGHALAGGSNPVVMDVELPPDLDGRPVWLGTARRDLAAAIWRLDIVPLDVVPARRRLRDRARAIEPIAGRDRAYLAYLDANAYPEGGVFWTRGESATTVRVLPAGASVLTLRLQAGAWSGPVTVSANGTTRTLPMQPWSEVRVDVPLPRDLASVPVVIQSPGGFRPSEVDPTVHDDRWLGCRVFVEVGD
jgi:hypothetical protein